MKYLVHMVTHQDQIPSAPPALLPHVERVIATHEAIIALQKEGKIVAGGMPVGKRENVAIFDVESHDELNQLLMSLPLFAISEVRVTALADHEAALDKLRKNYDVLRAALSKG